MPRDSLPSEEQRIRDRKANARYSKSAKGRMTRAVYESSENRRESKRSAWLRYNRKNRAIPGYKKWESLRTSAYLEARKQSAASNIFKPFSNPFVGKPMTTAQVANSWGIPPWREWVWQYVDYSKYEASE